MSSRHSKPTELMVALATMPGTTSHRSDGWMASDEIRARLEMFGFDCSSQQLVAMLKHMSVVDAPWIERRPSPWNERWFEYRLTVWGRNDITNKLPLIDLRAPWLEVARV